jgi:hypothetical protein
MTCKRNKEATLGIVLALAASAAATGCGGGSSTAAENQGSTSDTATITKAVLIKKGDAICRHTDDVQKARLAGWEKQHPKESLIETSVQQRALVYAAIPPLASEIEAIAALGLPKGQEGAVEAIVSGWRGALKGIEQMPSLLLEAGEGPFTQPDKLAGDFGFKDCAKAL